MPAREASGDAACFGSHASSKRGTAQAAKTETDPAGGRCLQALVVAIDQASDARRWYTATKELQLSSFSLCEACRGAHTVHLRVDTRTPTTLLESVDAPRQNPDGGVLSRVPRLRGRRVTWKLPSADLLSNRMEALSEAEELYFCDPFDASLEIRAWPNRLKKIVINPWSMSDHSIVGVTWPTSLQQLTFGLGFNQPIEEVKWPMSLERLDFGWSFNQPIKGVTWPTSLQHLIFLSRFNQRIDGFVWPPLLQELIFGGYFNQPIGGVVWPTSLRYLSLGHAFNQSVHGIVWPPLLDVLIFGRRFNQPINSVTWPKSLQDLWFGDKFSQSIDGVAWPSSLRQLVFGENFNQPLEGTSWPSSLRELRLRGSFLQSLQKLDTVMPALQRLTLQLWSDPFRNSILCDVEWPAGLTHLVVGSDDHLEGVSVPPTVSVSYDRAYDW
ncbi:unnamed protein product [Scytosiphon promiscuus]